MHIPDGVLAAPVLAFGAAVTVAGCAVALRRLEPERIPHTAVMSALFFVASLVHIPVGPSSVHFLLAGLMGVALGWGAFPAVVVGLILQAVLFGFGGVLVLGVNAMNIAVPAVLCGWLFDAVHRRGDGGWAGGGRAGGGRAGGGRMSVMAAGAAGALGVLLVGLCVALSLAMSGRAFLPAAGMVLLAHVPVMLAEGVMTAAAVGLILRVKPEVIPGGAPPFAVPALAGSAS
jgi:cobalt/nickel transport system permease protein